METTRRAAIYARVSTEEQIEGTSLEDQVRRCRDHAADAGWEVVGEFVDRGISGAKESRPELDRLLAGVEAGAFDVVVATKTDRVARDLRLLLNLLADMAGAGVDVATLDDPIDLDTPAGRAWLQMRGTFAEFERALISERTMSGLEARARAGRWPGGPPPFGYRIVEAADGHGKTLDVDPEEAETVRLAVEMIVDQGCSALEATHRLNAFDRPPPSAARRGDSDGMRWGHRGLATVLQSERLLGRVVWFQSSKTGRDPIVLQFEPVLDRCRWDALQAVLASRAAPGKGARHVYPLSGRVYGRCGQPYIGTYRRDRDRRDYRCNGSSGVRNPVRCDDRWRPRADLLEATVWAEVTRVLTEPGRLLAMARDYAAGLPPAPEGADQLEALQTRAASLEAALGARVGELLRAGVDAAAIKVASAELQTELEAARRHRDHLASLRAAEEEHGAREGRLDEFADAARARLGTLGPEGRKELFGLLGVRVQITEQGSRTDPGAVLVEGVLPQELVDAWGGTWHDSQAYAHRPARSHRRTGVPQRRQCSRR